MFKENVTGNILEKQWISVKSSLEKSDNIINKKYYMPNTKHAKS